MATHPFPLDARLTAIALAYRNPDMAYIADDVLPRTPVDFRFKWLSYNRDQMYGTPDTKVGRKSVPNEVEFNATEVEDRVEDYGLDDLVPNEDVDADNQGVDPLGMATTGIMQLVKIGREIRVANKVFAAATYPVGNKVVLAGATQWSDATSDPVAAIGDALDVPIMRPNIGVFGQATWTKLRRNPKIVQAIKGTDQGAGMVSREEFAEFFELQGLYIGQGFANTAKKGQPAAISRIWGKHAAFIYRDRTAGPQAGMTFGFTGEFGSTIAGVIPEPKVGLTGSQRVRAGERLKEIVSAADVAYFFENAVA